VRKLLMITTCAMMLIAASESAFAEADIGFKGVGGRLSFVKPSDIGSAFGFGGLVDLGTFAPNVGFGASLDLWWGSESSVDFRDIVIGANSRYLFEVDNPKVKPYAGGGLALHFVNVSIDAQTIGAITIPSGSETETRLGLDLFGGVSYATSDKVDIIGDVMFRLVSDVNQFVISAGIIYWLGQ